MRNNSKRDFPNVFKSLNIDRRRVQLTNLAFYSGEILNIFTFNNPFLKFTQCKQVNLK